MPQFLTCGYRELLWDVDFLRLMFGRYQMVHISVNWIVSKNAFTCFWTYGASYWVDSDWNSVILVYKLWVVKDIMLGQLVVCILGRRLVLHELCLFLLLLLLQFLYQLKPFLLVYNILPFHHDEVFLRVT